MLLSCPTKRCEIWLGKSLFGFRLLPKLCKTKADVIFSWLGGVIVWSRLKRTPKNTNRV